MLIVGKSFFEDNVDVLLRWRVRLLCSLRTAF
jgi:hypothetical protein